MMETERLIIDHIIAADIDFIYSGLSDPEVILYYGVSYTSKDAAMGQMEWYAALEKNNTGKWWILRLKENNTAIGACGFNYHQPQHNRIELGCWMMPGYQGKGFMFEALKTLIPFAVEKWNIHRLEALVEPENIACRKLLLKTGFHPEGILKDYEIKNGKYISLEVFAQFY